MHTRSRYYQSENIFYWDFNWVPNILPSELTFRAIIRPLGLCKTLVTTPPFPAPNSANLSKSSAFSSPIFLFSARNASNLSRCKESSSSSSNFFRISSTFCMPIPAASLLQDKKNNIAHNGQLTSRSVTYLTQI